jgi:hypothetical protein
MWGQLEALKWAWENGCPGMDRGGGEYTCARAAGAGQLEALQWLREQGCPWWILADVYLATP